MKWLTPQKLVFPLLLALAFTGWNGWQWGWGAWTESWPSVEGSISSSKASSYWMQGTLYHAPAVEYRYKVGDRSYIGDDVTVGGDEMSEEACDAFVERFPAGARVPVFHHPHQPQRSFLIPGRPSDAGLGALLGLGVSTILIALLIWRSRQPAEWAQTGED